MSSLGAEESALEARADALRGEGQTVMLVAVDGVVAGLVAVADPVKESAVVAVEGVEGGGDSGGDVYREIIGRPLRRQRGSWGLSLGGGGFTCMGRLRW